MRTATIFSLFVTLCAATGVAAKPTPDAEKQPSFSISEASIARIEPLDVHRLMDDSTFVVTLRAVLTDQSFSSAEKTDAFYLMLRKIGWDFTGTLRVFPRRNYFDTFNAMVMTYLSYQDAVADLQYDPADFLALASRECGEHVVRCSHALLLSAIVNPKASKPTVESLFEVSAIARAEVPSILLHNLSLATVLSRDASLVARFGQLLSEVKGEEEQEDILSAIGMFNATQMTPIVVSFLKEALKTKFDSAVETALVVLYRQLQGRAFEEAYADLLDVPLKPEWRSRLIELQQGGFAPLQKFAESGGCCGWIKLWGGFSLTMYDDGMVLVYGPGFRDFKPR